MTKAELKAMHENWGYWDGVNANGRLPVWAKASVYRPTHPHNKAYGIGFWIGFYGEPAPNKYTFPA